MKRNKKSGSLFENKQAPVVGHVVYAVIGEKPRPVIRGTVTQVWNTTGDLGGLTADLKTAAGEVYHAPINVLFDHKPHLSQRHDTMGQFSAYL